MRVPILDRRLQSVAELVRPGCIAADIGTDHGYLITYLAASGRIRYGYACDINEKPLKKAQRTIHSYGVGGKVRTLMSDGLIGLTPNPPEDLILAGMGGELIWRIIDGVSWTRDTTRHFILQPMTRADRLRRLLLLGGFSIEDETAVLSGGFIYTVLSAVYTGDRQDPDCLFCYTGKLLDKQDAYSRIYLERMLRKLRGKAEGLAKSRLPDPSYALCLQAASTLERKLKFER